MADVVLEEKDEELEEKDEEETGEEKSEEEKGKEGETDATGEESGEEEIKEEKDEEADKLELQLLRQITREQKKELVALKDAIEHQGKVLKDKGIFTEEDERVTADEKTAREARESQLEFLAEAMRVNPKFEDLDEVVSQEHFDEYVEAVADAYVRKNGGEVAKVVAAIEQRIWAMPNPYKFLYNEIKTYHPAYRKADNKGKDEEGGKKGKEKEVKAATSLADLPGTGGKGTGGWTAARIDEMPEDELNKVPTDIYQKYLRGELK